MQDLLTAAIEFTAIASVAYIALAAACFSTRSASPAIEFEEPMTLTADEEAAIDKILPSVETAEPRMIEVRFPSLDEVIERAIAAMPVPTLSELGIRELRKLGTQAGIKGAARMNKATLTALLA